MSCCSVGAIAPAVVTTGTPRVGSRTTMMATAARRIGLAPASRGVTAVAALAGARPAAVPALASSNPGASSPWGAVGARGLARNVFNRHAIRAVADPETGVAEPEPVKLLTSDESEELLKIRHTTAHICAMATQKLFPDAQCTIGPWCAPDPPAPRPRERSASDAFIHRPRGDVAAAWRVVARANRSRPPPARPNPRRIDRGFYYDFYYPEGFSGAFEPHPRARPGRGVRPRPRAGGDAPKSRSRENPPSSLFSSEENASFPFLPRARALRLGTRPPPRPGTPSLARSPPPPLLTPRSPSSACSLSADKDLKSIKKQMIKIINKDYPLRREEVSREEARRRITELNEPYKLEILDAIETEPITIYHIGDEWWDLCAGPHVESTKKIHPKAIDLESVAGAYWRGDETKPMLQRIYGTAWGSPEEMKAYDEFKLEAARRDHRKVGKDLNLFSIQQEEVGGGLVFWHPKGAMMRNIIENFWKDIHLERGYDLLYTPHVGKLDLWQTSGHADFYGENMYRPIDVEDETYQLKPMNCPFHVAVYKDGYFSYRDLPIRWAELGTVYRYERSGTMHGLFRVRGFTQDDAHIFCLPDQIASEIKGVLDLTEDILSTFGFTEFEVNLSTQPEKSVGGPEIWNKAEDALKEALANKGWDYEVDEGGGAFYGPKIDVKILDAIGRKWQCSTVQLDFNLPERFDLNYVDAANEKRRPIMIHRAIFGSLERFFGILTENYAGAFPLWVAPTQVRLLPVTDAVDDYVQETAAKMRAAGVRVDVTSNERLAKLVRNAEKAKVPVMCIVGEQEAKDGTLTVRTYADGDQGAFPAEEVLARVAKANAEKGEKL